MNNVDLQKVEKFKKVATLAGIGVAGIVVAPVVMLSIKGIVGAAIAAAAGFVVVQLSPWFALKVTNWKYRLIEKERTEHISKVTEAAAENPIETLQNILNQNRISFEKFKESVTTAVTARDTFSQKVDGFKKLYPARAAEFEAQLVQMTNKIERKKAALSEAKRQLDVGKAKLDEMKAYWEMSQALQDANAAANLDIGDAYAQLKMDTAVDSVFESMNKAFAQLEIDDHLMEDTKSLDYQPQDVIVDTVVSNKVKV